jgi:hypothetical protein
VKALPNANIQGLATFGEALAETERQVKLLAEYVRECPQMTISDRQMLVTNIEWLRGYYVRLEQLCLEALTVNE